MEFKELQSEIIRKSINSAICIDDDMLAPYEIVDDPNKPSYLMPQSLYASFREDAKCDLDIYHYKSFEEFKEAQSYLFNHKDLLILDWELQNEAPHKFIDSVSILHEALLKSSIHFVVIYTNAPDLDSIAHQVIIDFCDYTFEEEEQKLQDFKSKLDELLIEKDIDKSVDDMMNAIHEELKGYVLYPDKDAACDILRNKVIDLFQKKINVGDIYKFLKKLGFDPTDFPLWLDYMLSTKSQKKMSHRILNIDRTTLLVDNTIVYIANKEAVKPEKVYAQVCEKTSNITNLRSLLLSLLVKEELYLKVPQIGRGLIGINDSALLQKVGEYKALNDFDGLMDFVTECFTGELVETLLHEIDKEKIQSLLWDSYDDKPQDIESEELCRLNSFLTFIPKERFYGSNHNIYTGDIFEVEINNTPSYLICVSQGCDCSHPDKIDYNYAFAKGVKCPVKESLQHAEDDNYTYFQDGNTTIKWTKKFQTIYLKDNYQLDKDAKIEISLNGETTAMHYLGRQKDHFAQRILNYVFNNAMRIGADLVKLLKEEEGN